MQETENLAPGKQCAAVTPVPGRRADKSVTNRATREPLGVSARGAGRVSSAETQWACGRGGPVQHAALGSQRAALEGRQRASLSPWKKGKSV